MIESYVEKKMAWPTEAYDMEPGIIYVYQNDGEEVDSVDFLCPCGCGSSCYTPVVANNKPKFPRQWTFSRGPNGVTLSPSIRYTGGCKAHFNITDGKVIMHSDSGK